MRSNVRNLEDVITVIKQYKEIIKTQKYQIIHFVAKQEQIFKKIRNWRRFLRP